MLFDQSHILSRGAVAKPARFPFAVTIPETSQPGFAARGDNWKREKSESRLLQRQQSTAKDGGEGGGHRQGCYLSSSQDNVTNHGLPSTYYFTCRSDWSGVKFEAYIEYVLEASLVCPGADSVTAQFPVLIRSHSTAKPIQGSDYELKVREATRKLRTELLLPENAERKMTFRERQRRFWNPSRIPRYAYTAKLVHPTVIQLEHPEPIPFKLFIVPRLQDELTSICPDGDLSRLPPVEFVSIELSLKSKIRIRTPGTFTNYHEEEREHEFPIRFKPLRTNHTLVKVPFVVRGNIRDEPPPNHSVRGTPIKLAEEKYIAAMSSESHHHDNNNAQLSIWPVSEDTVEAPSMPMLDYSHFSPSEEGQFLMGMSFDLGAHLGIRLSQRGSSTLGAVVESPYGRLLYPSFDTYNISLTYQLKWTIRLSCAGESHRVHGIDGVRVLPPSKEQDAFKKGPLRPGGMRK